MRILFFTLTALLLTTACSKNKNGGTSTASSATNSDSAVGPAPPIDSVRPVQAPFLTTGYVGVNNNSLHNAGCYIMNLPSQSLTFAIIFAANINSDNGKATLYYNPATQASIQSGDIAYLQSLGIKVLLSVLGNHEDAGWSCFIDYAAADNFAAQLAQTVTTYNLDGIDIDDEYSTCTPNDSSLVIALYALRARLGTKKYITKALFGDKQYFTYKYNGVTAGNILNYGWEMDYGNLDYNSRLQPYTSLGMAKTKLFVGVDLGDTDEKTASQFAKDSSYAGVMMYNVTDSSLDHISWVTTTLLGEPTSVTTGCLQ